MAIPIAAIRYAGIWSATVQYYVNDSVTSPIDDRGYVTLVNVLGGADQSTGIVSWVILPENGGGGGVTTLQGLGGIVSLGSPSDTISFNTSGQTVELDVTGLPLGIAVTALNGLNDGITIVDGGRCGVTPNISN